MKIPLRCWSADCLSGLSTARRQAITTDKAFTRRRCRPVLMVPLIVNKIFKIVIFTGNEFNYTPILHFLFLYYAHAHFITKYTRIRI